MHALVFAMTHRSLSHAGLLHEPIKLFKKHSMKLHSRWMQATLVGNVTNVCVCIFAVLVAAVALVGCSGGAADGNSAAPGDPDTAAPTAPNNVVATAVAPTQINLSWDAATDNVAVTSYQVDRCSGASCTNFAQVVTSTVSSHNNTGLAANTTYRYRVRAVDGAGNLSGYSGNASATTQSGGTGNTITAASCSQANVQTAVSSAVPGDTVAVPAGTCSWSGGLSISGIQLIGAGKSTSGTVITAGAVSMTKHATEHTRVSGFRFTASGRQVTVGGSPTSKPYIIDNNYFFMSGTGSSQILGITVNGGLLHHNDFTASSGTGADVLSIATSEDWSQAPTFGTADTTGERNIYFEDNTFTNILETAPDGDAGGRFGIRYNTYIDSSIVWHGGHPNDSSPFGGVRQFEIYNNTFDRVSNSAPINKWIWARGSSGVIANNSMERAESPDGFSYPNKAEIRLTVGCPNPYPMQYQVGQSNQTPENPPSRPLLIFGNTGAGSTDGNFITVGGQGGTGLGTYDCSNAGAYIQLNRDYYLSNQWGWTPYTYPHPLQGGTTAP